MTAKKEGKVPLKKKGVVEVVGKSEEKEGEKNGSRFQKTYVITAAQAIQDERHARYYGPDESKGAPNIPLIENIDRYAGIHDAETMILQMQGMSCEEIQLDPYFERRDDVYINKNKLGRLEAQIEMGRAKIERRIDKLDNRIDRIEGRIVERKEEEKDTSRLTSSQEELERRRGELEVSLDDIRDAEYFQTIGITPLNTKLIVADIIVPPQNVDPSTSRIDIPQNKFGKTVIFAHAKQRWKCAPKNIGHKLPRLLLTTGAVTFPNYNTTNDRGDNALLNHKFGFVVVDVLDKEKYLPRIVPALKNGSFVDMGIEHRLGQRPKKIGVDALVLGDIHFGDHDQTTMDANYEMMEYFAPENVFLHDAINGHSVNPHEREDKIKRAIAFEEGRLDIKTEFAEAYEEFVKKMAKQFLKTQFHFVYSNHSPDFLRRYLTECNFTEEPWNFTDFTLDLVKGLRNKEDPVQRGLELIAEEKKINGLPKNINFLLLRNGLIIQGYQLGVHGHKGINGARGTPSGMKKGYSKGIFGHTHTPEINGDCITVGTSSITPLEYAEGQPATVMAANGVLYKNGLAQLIPIIGEYWMPPSLKK